jgi:hypothetical protein
VCVCVCVLGPAALVEAKVSVKRLFDFLSERELDDPPVSVPGEVRWVLSRDSESRRDGHAHTHADAGATPGHTIARTYTNIHIHARTHTLSLYLSLSL